VTHFVLLLGLFSGVPMSAADPLADYEEYCEAPIFEHLSKVLHPSRKEYETLGKAGRAAAKATCWAYVERLEAESRPTAEQRLALLVARGQLGSGPSAEPFCDEIRTIETELPDHPEVLYELYHCTEDDIVGITLLRRALEIDPNNRAALRALTMRIRHTGDTYGIEPATLLRYGTTLYQMSEYAGHKISAARSIFAVAVFTDDRETAAAIRKRIRRDLGLDALDYGPERRAGSLQRACGGALFYLDLEDICLSAVEKIAADAAAVGEPIPREALRHMAKAFERWNYAHWSTGPKTGAAARLKAVLEAHPQKSSEHHRVLAQTAPVWSERIARLRRAVETDGGNLRARCDLAEDLAYTGARVEAAAQYADLLALRVNGRLPCEPEAALARLQEQALHGTPASVAPEDPVEFVILN